jgi:chromosome segregation ATPase
VEDETGEKMAEQVKKGEEQQRLWKEQQWEAEALASKLKSGKDEVERVVAEIQRVNTEMGKDRVLFEKQMKAMVEKEGRARDRIDVMLPLQQKEVSKKQAELEKEQRETLVLTLRLEEARGRAEEGEKEAAEAEEEREAERKLLNGQCINLEDELEKLKEELADLQGRSQKVEWLMAQAQEEGGDLSQRLERVLLEKGEVAEDEMARVAALKKELEEQRASIRSEMGGQAKGREKSKEKLEQLKQERDRVRDEMTMELNAKAEELDKAERELADRTADVAGLQQRWERTLEMLEDPSGRVVEAEKELRDVWGELVALGVQRVSLEEDLSAAVKEQRKRDEIHHEQEIRARLSELEDVTSMVKVREKKLNDLESMYDELNMKYKKLQSDVANERSALADNTSSSSLSQHARKSLASFLSFLLLFISSLFQPLLHPLRPKPFLSLLFALQH